jgi:hypothetical protein
VNSNDDISESFSYTAASQMNSRQLTVTNNNYIYAAGAGPGDRVLEVQVWLGAGSRG